MMTSLQKDVGDALRIDDIDKPADAQIATGEPVTPAAPTPETFVEAETHTATVHAAEAHAAGSEPLAITREVLPAPQDITPAAPDVLKDAKAS
jgi:sec-independent protein translocase protein TatB